MSTLTELRDECAGLIKSPEYLAKMRHKVPDFPKVDRIEFILARAVEKVVLDIGASGPMHAAICEVASRCWGIDRQDGEGVAGFDLDDVTQTSIPYHGEVDLVVCGEVIEHLGNPLHFLKRLRATYRDVPVIVSTPNAMNDGGRKWLENGWENVNIDHVAYYSHRTLTTLIERAGYTISEFYWYGPGRPKFSEGMIAVCQ